MACASVPPGVKKGTVKYLWKRALSCEKGTFTRAFQYRGHFANGELLQQEPPTWTGTASNTYLQSTLQAYFYFYMIAQYFDPWPPT